MPSSVRLFLKVLFSFAFVGSVYWVFSTMKTNPFSVEPEPVVATISSLIALIVAMYEKNKDSENAPSVAKTNTATINGSGNTVLQDVQNNHFKPVIQNHSGSGDNVAGDKIQK
jgi:hypothetical protein